MNQDVVARLAGIEVQTSSGEPYRLGSAWASQPVILVLVRHFGCIFCKEQTSKLHDQRARIHGAGGELLIVGSGAPMFATAFVEDFKITTPVYCDPGLATYAAVGARHGLWSSLQPRVWFKALRTLAKGFRQTRTAGEMHQQGGVFVITPDGTMPFRYLSRYAGDHPPVEAILGALEAAAAGARRMIASAATTA